MSGGLQLTFLDPKTPATDAQIEGVTQTISKAFQDFNASVNAAPEIVEEEFGNPVVTPMIVSGFFKSLCGYSATNADGKVVGVSFVDVRAKGSSVASLGPVSSTAPGAGRLTFEAACAHAEKLGFPTLVLMQIAANSRSFSLYAKL